MSAEFHAGSLIDGMAIGSCLKWYWDFGHNAHAWVKVRKMCEETWPEAKANSIDALIRIAQEATAVGRLMRRKGPDYAPKLSQIPDCRRLIQSARRARDAG
jgi:hypothetical protein